ncbi:39S ribosomal protein L44, mitochondrial [Tyrophagus putrescentiae]|nr:39S ribosomal protein L44, mitochondrial [Tyrophagus putrescentiae]
MSFNLQLVASKMAGRLALHHHLQLRSLHSVFSNSSSSSSSYSGGSSKQPNQNQSHNKLPSLLQKTSFNNIHHQQVRTLMKLWKEKTLREMYWRGRRFDKVPEQPFVPRSDFQEWSYSAEVAAFAARLGEPQLTEAALTRAFTHRSFVSAEQAKQSKLGIADVQLAVEDNADLVAEGRRLVADYLRPLSSLSPSLRAGGVHRIGDAVPALGGGSGGDLILCEELPPLPSTLADTVPALVATLFRASGRQRTERFIVDFLLTVLHGADLLEVWPLHLLDVDLDSYLALQNSGEKSEARILRQSAVGTLEACYVVGIYSTGERKQLLGEAPGESLPIARRMAELDAFRRLFRLTVAEVRLTFGDKVEGLELAAFEGRPNFSMLQPRSAENAAQSVKVKVGSGNFWSKRM